MCFESVPREFELTFAQVKSWLLLDLNLYSSYFVIYEL